MLRGIRKATFALTAALALSGCSWSDVLLEEARAVPRDASFGFRQGYLAACRTAIADQGGIGFDKPAAVEPGDRVVKEADYKAGWEQGTRNCADRYAGWVLHRDLMMR